MAITLLTATLGAVAFSIERGMSVEVKLLFHMHLQLGSLLLLLFLCAWLAFYFMDRGWYHRLLKGAVSHAMKIEEEYPELPFGLSAAIKTESPIKLFGFKIDSSRKIDIFYCSITAVLILAAGVIQLGLPSQN